MRLSDWSSDVCSADLVEVLSRSPRPERRRACAVPHRRRDGDLRPVGVRRLQCRPQGSQGREGSQAGEGAGQGRGQVSRSHPRGARSQGVRQAEQRSEEHTSELQSLMRISYAVFCLKKKKTNTSNTRQKTDTNKRHYANQI